MKTSTQFQTPQTWARPVLRYVGAEWVKYINPPDGPNPCPEVPHSVVRVWTDDRDARYLSRGREGGREFVRDMLATWRRWPWATCYELANEPPCNSPQDLANLREYSIGAMEEADAHGIKLCILNLAEGNPGADAGLTGDAARASERWKLEQLVDAVKYACAHGHYIGLHAYWKPGVCPDGPADRWHALGRRIWDVEQWADMGVDTSRLKVLINECGIDGGIAGGILSGWRLLLGDYTAYAEQMRQAEEIASRYPWMVALIYFVSGGIGGWQSYEVDAPLLQAAAARIRTLAQPATAYGPDPNVPYWHSDRHGYKPEWIIIHDTEGTAEAALAWWRSADNPGKSSAHYLVRADGVVVPVVPEQYAAHHAGGGKWPGIPAGEHGGTSIINLVSIGVELEYPKAPASPPWPEAQLVSAVRIVADVARRYGIPRERILRHLDVDPQNRSDPRNLDWAMFLARVMEEIERMDEQQIRNAAWAALDIPYNPDAAFPRYAREHGLGNPVTRETDVAGYRLQGFSGGIVYARIGDWGNTRHIAW